MADKFGLKIGIEGEKEFKKALNDINQSFKVLGSEMKLVESQFDKNDNSVEALTARNEVLGKSIEAQKSKIEVLRSALANASSSFGETDKRTQAWQVQLNNAQAELNKMEGNWRATIRLFGPPTMALRKRRDLPMISVTKWKMPENRQTILRPSSPHWAAYAKPREPR